MPRRSKGPQLALERGKWYIRDGQAKRGTGVNEGNRAEAEKKLAEYILGKHDAAGALRSVRDPNQAKIADVIAVAMTRVTERTDLTSMRKNEFINLYERMGEWFGEHTVGDLNGSLQRQYVAERKRYVTKMVDGVRTLVKTDEPARLAPPIAI